MNKPISLCITAYDQDYNFLDNLLNQLKLQTEAPMEILVYCSGLNKLVLDPYIVINNTKVPLYLILSQKRTIQSIARNICSKIASGEIIIFFDVDDFPHTQKIEITNYIFKKYNPDFFVHNYSETPMDLTARIDKSNLIIKSNLSVSPTTTNIVCDKHPIHHAHIAVQKTVFANVIYNESMTFYRKEDGKFCQDLLNHKYNGLYTPTVLVQYN